MGCRSLGKPQKVSDPLPVLRLRFRTLMHSMSEVFRFVENTMLFEGNAHKMGYCTEG